MILVQKQKYNHGKKEEGLLDTTGTDLAIALSLSIHTPLIRARNYEEKLIINWGCCSIPWLTSPSHCLNKPMAVLSSSNKIRMFERLADCTTVPSTTIRQTALDWLEEPFSKIVCRGIVSGSQGNGITICRKGDEVPVVPLYTLYIRKKWEYRVHVVLGKVVAIQQKRRLSSEHLEERGITARNKYIRNSANGYIYSSILDHKDNEEVMFFLRIESLMAINALELDFGGVDLLVTPDNKVMILEVNSACGLEASTLKAYIDRFSQYIEEV